MPNAHTYKKEKNRSNVDKGGYRHKTGKHKLTTKKQDPLQFMSVWMPLISFISKKHDLSFQILVSKFEKWKGGFFIVGPNKHKASLRHCEQAHGKCKALIGSSSQIVPLIVHFITPSNFQKHTSTQLEKHLCENNISGWFRRWISSWH